MITNHDLKHESNELARMLEGAQTLSPELRARVIALRTRLFQRGIFDPVLARFDSATVAQPAVREVAQQLAKVAGAMH